MALELVPMPRARPGFMIRELVVVIAVTLIVVLVTTVMIVGGRRGGFHDPPLRDVTEVRGILSGMVVWSQSNRDRFPLPSVLDTANATVPDTGAAKDTTANIFSILVYNSFFPPEVLASADEKNPNIVRMDDYAFDHPATAVDPLKALWDPALNADFTGAKPANVSYANLLPVLTQPDAAGRIWYGANSNPTQPVIGNRGPQIESVSAGGAPTYTPLPPGKTSYSVLTHGKPGKWLGNIGYADNHVDFETVLSPHGITYTTADGKRRPDVLFFDEPDDARGDNAFLGIFTKAGAERKGFKSIWD